MRGLQTKKAFPLLAVLWAAFSFARADAPIPLTTIGAIHSLSLAEASRNLPVQFEGTVTFYQGARHYLFAQDQGTGVFVKTTGGEKFEPGERVLIKGKTDWGYRPFVVASEIKALGSGPMPKPALVRLEQLTDGQFHSLLVVVRGVVHSADMSPGSAEPGPAMLTVSTDAGYLDVNVLNADPHALEPLLDSTVEITGVAGGKFDGKAQLTGVTLQVTSLANVKVLKPATQSPWSLPLTPMGEILSTYRVDNQTRRETVSGTVTYFEPGSAMVLQSGERSLWVKTDSFAPVRIGDHALASGFPDVSNGFLVLTRSEIEDSGLAAPIPPKAVEWQEIALSRHLLDLVSIEGRVIMDVRESTQDEYVLVAGGHIFSAIYSHANARDALGPMVRIQPGSTVRVTGICASNYANPFGHDVPFNVLLRSPGDLELIKNPSFLTVHNLALLAILLLVIVLLLGVRVLYVGSSTRARLAELGYLSQRRGEILEDINNSKPLPEILERITELASASLKGAPCWCEMGDGLMLGNRPPGLGTQGLRVTEHLIGHAKPALGTLFAAFDARTNPQTDEDRALATAAELATLAIENSRFHSELLHRSEFDMLTEIQNRFSFEKHLDALLDWTHANEGVFGLVYIDLNGFKQVNDVYGHQMGDVFLQRVAKRMRHQLRAGDLLARVGGDEFALLVPVVHKRADLEEIAVRLQRCFEEPFRIEGRELYGSASVGIALYPDDATTKDGLMSAADSAMYMAKRAGKSAVHGATA